MKSRVVVGYYDKSLKKFLFHAGVGFYASDVQSANIFKNKKAALKVVAGEKRYFAKQKRKDVKMSIFRSALLEVR